MPQTASATKALRINQRRRQRNDLWRQRVHNVLRQLRLAVTANKPEEAKTLLPQAHSLLDRAARRHIIHTNRAVRQKSQLQQMVSKLETTKKA